jgi:hypothetical protein
VSPVVEMATSGWEWFAMVRPFVGAAGADR